MLPDVSDNQPIALCEQCGRNVVSTGPPPTTQTTQTDPPQSRPDADAGDDNISDSVAHLSSISQGPSLQLELLASPSLSVSSITSMKKEPSQPSRTMALLSTDIPRHYPLHSSHAPTGLLHPSIPVTPTPPLPSISAHNQPQRRAVKRKRHAIHSGTDESGVENPRPPESFGGGSLLAQVEKLREDCAALPVPDPHFIVGSVHGGKVLDLSMHLAKRDALIAELVNTLLKVTQELTERIRGLEKDDTSSIKYMYKGGGLVKKRKVQKPILEPHLTDSIKVLVHSVIQKTLHWRPGRTNQLPSAGATYQDKQANGTYTTVEIRVPDWDMGPKSNENAKWMQDIKREVKAGIEEDIGDLGHKWTDRKIQPVILEAMEYQIYTYYETLKRKYKDQNDEERAKRKGTTDLRLKRDQRVRALRSRLTNQKVLKEVNIAIDLAAQDLHSPSIEIQADDLPFEALSDLESDPEDISMSDRARYQKEAHIDRVASTKWMSRQKIWTSGAFEALKGLFKQVTIYVADEGLVAQKKAPATLHYSGPATHREPGFMNVQVWMVDPTIINHDQMKSCKQNREAFMNMEEGVLLRVFTRAQEVAKGRKEWSVDGGDGEDEVEM